MKKIYHIMMICSYFLLGQLIMIVNGINDKTLGNGVIFTFLALLFHYILYREELEEERKSVKGVKKE